MTAGEFQELKRDAIILLPGQVFDLLEAPGPGFKVPIWLTHRGILEVWLCTETGLIVEQWKRDGDEEPYLEHAVHYRLPPHVH